VSEHIVPPELALDDAVEADLALERDDFLASAAVGVENLLAFVTADEVCLLVSLQIGQFVLGPVRQREQAGVVATISGIGSSYEMTSFNISYSRK